MTRKARAKATAALPLEVRSAIKAVVEDAAERAAKRVLYRSQDTQKKMMRDVLVEAGLVHADPDEQKQKAADEVFVRELREAARGRPAKIGFALLSMLLGVVGALITFAAQSFLAPVLKFFVIFKE